MKLEDCTKEEIIHYLRRRCFDVDKDIEFDIQRYRSERAMEEEHQHWTEASNCLEEYIELLSPYEGKPIGSVPDGILKKAGAAMKRREKYLLLAGAAERRYNRAEKRTSELISTK